MITLKQIEAFYAIATVGSFVAAAENLRTTQPALSKRIAEMEMSIGASLFDRSLRTVQLTAKGHAILKMCGEMLRIRSEILEVAGERLHYSGIFRLGITELVAQTILPDLVTAINGDFPEMALHPEVNLSRNLYEKLEGGKLDLAIVPGTYQGELVSEFLGDVELKCICNPMRLACPDRLEIGELVRYPLISQTDRSALQAAVEDHLRRNNVAPTTRLSCNSLSAISGLALGGLGIGVLPSRLYLPRVASGELKVIELTPELPALEYFISYRGSGFTPVCQRLALIIKDVWYAAELARPRQRGL